MAEEPETPFANEETAAALSKEFHKFQKKMQYFEAQILGKTQEGAKKGKDEMVKAGNKVTESSKKALNKLADELEQTAKDLRKKAQE